LVEVNSQSYTYRETILYDVPEDDRAKLRFVEAERQRGRKIWLEETGSQRKTVKEIVKEKEYASTQTYRYDDQGRLMYQKAFDRVLTFEYGKKGTEPARITVYKESGEKECVWRLRKKDDGPQPEKDRLNATSRVIIISSYKYVKE
jgi:hypothetical protein